MKPTASFDPIHRQRQQWKFLALALLFFGPLALAFVLYYGNLGFKPGGNAAHGTLFDPIRPLPDVALAGPAGEPLGSRLFHDHWSYVYRGAGSCEAGCRTALAETRQARLLLGHDASRVHRIFLYSGTASPELCRPDSDLTCASVDAAPDLAGVIDAAASPAGLSKDAVFLVDPHGNLVLGYGPTERLRALLEDTKRLFKYSHIG